MGVCVRVNLIFNTKKITNVMFVQINFMKMIALSFEGEYTYALMGFRAAKNK